MVIPLLLAANPFTTAFEESDLFGKCIFLGLITASIVSWCLIAYKGWFLYAAQKASFQFYTLFQKQQENPLAIAVPAISAGLPLNPFLHLYAQLKKHTGDLVKRNQKQGGYLSERDLSTIESHLANGIANQIQLLDSHLFILALIVTLGPFLGLLGTVWGILSTFAELQAGGGALDNKAILGGISLALATTVLGLLDAIPALIGYGYLKQRVRNFTVEMECFSHEMLTSVEMHYKGL